MTDLDMERELSGEESGALAFAVLALLGFWLLMEMAESDYKPQPVSVENPQ